MLTSPLFNRHARNTVVPFALAITEDAATSMLEVYVVGFFVAGAFFVEVGFFVVGAFFVMVGFFVEIGLAIVVVSSCVVVTGGKVVDS